ncbi:Calcineurin-like phosphoesterase [Oryzisolibacter propanilivorax]|uniref:Calcineurin-like phosphoesterase n=1 Tax=Oryzisolibacter propanilivorax TaxID=1527607 RepID=A0A1G9RRH5_9BURK|nr:metallophosphoesterase [Oryzisolibacter propanilivorax]SDM25690.1 Calcineurin-like phosphoesterase [Oryzisolibacter propanilivorax]
MSLVQPLPDGPLDIVGDIHGEFAALQDLLRHLGYDDQGRHRQGRTLVFVGDFCDRGPDSPAVLALARRLVEAGRALAVLGNHEFNLLRGDAKDGSGWFFDARQASDESKYAPYARPAPHERAGLTDFLARLPAALERADLRVVHAVWQDAAIAAARAVPLGQAAQVYGAWEQRAVEHAAATGLDARVAAELAACPAGLEDVNTPPPLFLHAYAEHEANKQMFNPLKVLTSGVEQPAVAPFFTSGKWRFAKRVPWWDDYSDATPVVVGHYWRRLEAADREALGKGDADLFAAIDPLHWHGRRGNVFCVDFSVGGRWATRQQPPKPAGAFRLAALRWPERTLQFDDGSTRATAGFGQPQGAQP